MGDQVYLRGLRDMKVAPWTSEDSYGTAYDIKGARDMGFELVVESDQLEGDDVVLDRYSKIIAANFSFANAAVDAELLSILTGGTFDDAPTPYEDTIIGENDTIPYVAMAGRIIASDGKEVQIFIPKAKLSGNLSYSFSYGQYVIPSAEFQGVNEGSTNGIAKLRTFTGPTTLTIPLATAVD